MSVPVFETTGDVGIVPVGEFGYDIRTPPMFTTAGDCDEQGDVGVLRIDGGTIRTIAY